MRLLVLGMGGHLGTAVAKRFDGDASVTMLGLDIEPPRRLLRRAEFHLVTDLQAPRARRDMAQRIEAFAPTHVAHFGVYEPHARANPRAAHMRTMAFTSVLRDALGSVRSVQRLVGRSGIEVYGRQRGAALSPDELVVPDPTCGYGRTLLLVEQQLAAMGRDHGASVVSLRFAPVAGPHIPSPLTRYLRLPLAVPVGVLPDPPFSLLHIDDAAAATVAALVRPAVALDPAPDAAVNHKVSLAVNVVGAGAVTAAQAVRIGRRIPIPTVGPGWLFARLVAGALGSPLPEHVIELLTRGRTADGAHARDVLGFAPEYTTREIIDQLYHWPAVTYPPVGVEDAA